MKSIPFGVGKLLETAIARVRRICLIRGIALTGIVWVLGVVAVMTVDSRIVIFDDRIRTAMTAGIWILALLVALLAIVLPLRRKISFRKMAGILDACHPEHEERLMTLVELSETDAKKAGFSPSLFALVCDLAEQDAAKVEVKREFPMFRAWRRFGVFAALLLALGIGAAVSPDLVGRLFVRAVAPWVDIGNLFSKDITVRPGDLVILSGSVIRIEATPSDSSITNHQPLTTNHYTIRLSRRTAHGWTEETSEPMGNGVYETTADLNEREWRYRVTAGPAVTRYYYVRVSEMPKYDLFRATVTYPDYTGQKPLVVTNAEVGAIKAVAGSRVRFEVRASSPDTVVDFRIDKEPLWEHVMVSNRTANWSLDLVNGDGFRAEKGRAPLTSFVDQPPTVVIEKPTGTLRLPSHAKIPVEITATDDIGISAAYLRVSIDGEPWERHFRGDLDLSGDRRFIRQVADVDLSLYNLVFAKNIRFDVIVDDACPPELGGPHSATSMPFTIQFAENESNYAIKELQKEVTEARQDIDEARRRLADAQRLAQQVRDELKRSEKPTENAERNSEKMAHELDEAEKRIEALRNEFLADERFEPLSRPMDRLLDEALKPALETVEKSQFREKDERAEAVDKAIPEMEKAVQELNDLTKRLEERAEKVDRFEKAKDLAARQEALAKAAQEILKERPTDTAKLEAWKRLEEAAMRKTEELARQKPDPEFAEARRKMETAAREMADLKRELDEAKQRAEAAKREAEKLERQKKDLAQSPSEAARQLKNLQELEGRDPKTAAKLRADQSAAREQAAAEQSRAADALQAAAAQRAEELAKRRAGDKSGAEAKAKEAVASQKKATDAQRLADENLKKGGATDGVKAMQKLATEAAADAQKAPRSAVKADEAVMAQREAAAALKQEQAIRADIEKGQATAADLEAFDRALQEAVAEKSSERSRARSEEAERAKRTRTEADAQGRELQNAVNDQKRAAEALRNAAARRADESKLREANNTVAADQKAREAESFERQAAEAQRASEDRLERGEALEGVKALQQQATDAARRSRSSTNRGESESFPLQKKDNPAAVQPQPSTSTSPLALQQAATEALQQELAVREGIRKDELTSEDLDTLDRRLKEGLFKEAAVRTQAAEKKASEAVAAAKEAIGTEEQDSIDRLAEAALQAKRDAVGAELAESKLQGTEARTEALRAEENALEALKSTDAEASALEKQIQSLQQSAVQALERNDHNRAMSLQKDIARVQARAAEAAWASDDAKEAREAASEAQAEAQEATAAAHRSWNNDTKEKAIAAQKAAMEIERNAQTEAHALRAMDKISAADRQTPQTSQTPQPSQTPSAAAEAAADALDREVKAQAAALGMSAQRASEKSGGGKGEKKDKDESVSGGGVSGEVSDLARSLRRNDSPDFFKDLFSRLGWFKVRGTSKDGLRDGDLKDVPREYRDLVRRYFLKLSEEQP